MTKPKNRFEKQIISSYYGFVEKMRWNYNKAGFAACKPTFHFDDNSSETMSDPRSNTIQIGTAMPEVDIETKLKIKRFECIREAARHMHYQANESFRDYFYATELFWKTGKPTLWPAPYNELTVVMANFGAIVYQEITYAIHNNDYMENPNPKSDSVKKAKQISERAKKDLKEPCYRIPLLEELVKLSPDKLRIKLRRMFGASFAY